MTSGVVLMPKLFADSLGLQVGMKLNKLRTSEAMLMSIQNDE